jgi:hypothetical protein
MYHMCANPLVWIISFPKTSAMPTYYFLIMPSGVSEAQSVHSGRSDSSMTWALDSNTLKSNGNIVPMSLLALIACISGRKAYHSQVLHSNSGVIAAFNNYIRASMENSVRRFCLSFRILWPIFVSCIICSSQPSANP